MSDDYHKLPKHHCFNCKHFISTKSTICKVSSDSFESLKCKKEKEHICAIWCIINGIFKYPNFHNKNLKCEKYKTDYMKLFFSNIVGSYFKVYALIFPHVLIKLIAFTCFIFMAMLVSSGIGLYIYLTQGVLVYLCCNIVMLFSFPFLAKKVIEECKRIKDVVINNEDDWLRNEVQRRNDLLKLKIESPSSPWVFTDKLSQYKEFSTKDALEILKKEIEDECGIAVKEDNPKTAFLFDSETL